ncbi:MAG TPA: ArsA-related P-loop ATPase, partial [Acidimicrobiia bacterium]|nr:ArsA-related P-loop ATPase [Acidimicrobiia bacterium]
MAGSIKPFTWTTSMRPPSEVSMPDTSSDCARAGPIVESVRTNAIAASNPSRRGRTSLSYHEAMEVADFCSTSRVVIVAGKGGVGKTTVTAALAVTAARAGMKTLIVEVEGKSGLPTMFGADALGYDELALEPGIRARFLTPDAALIDYLESHGMKRISKRLAASGALEVVATAVPGMKDILVLGKVKQIDESRTADLVIVDAPAAGHAITFLLSARGLLDAVRMGPVRKQAQDVVDLLSDPARCQVMLVTLPEETPVSEVIETAFAIED